MSPPWRIFDSPQPRAGNYHHIFKWLKEKGYEGVIGMEHGMSKKGVEGETVLLEAYRRADNAHPVTSPHRRVVLPE